MLLSTANNILYVIELTVGFETNIDNNASRKYEKYRNLIQELSSNYHKVKFINISISSLCVFGNSCDAYTQMYKDLNCEEKHLKYILQAPRCDFESGGAKISKWGSMSDGTLRGYFVLK